MSLILDLIGVLGFLLSGILAYFYLRNYFGRLVFRLDVLEVYRRKSLPYSYLIFHFSFSNQSSRGKTVHALSYGLNAPDYVRLNDSLYSLDHETNMVVLGDEKGDEGGKIPHHAFLEFRLDIPAHQSRSKCYPLHIAWVNLPEDKEVLQLPFEIEFSCYDHDNKIIGKQILITCLDVVMHSAWIQQ